MKSLPYILDERYEVLEMLGRGGMGEVWHALDLKLRVEVALKALRPEFFKSEPRLELLRQEVSLALRVSHRHVCRVHDLVEADGHTFVSMVYVDGEDLAVHLARQGRLSPGRWASRSAEVSLCRAVVRRWASCVWWC